MVENERGVLSTQPKQMRQVLVCPLFPPGSPNELIHLSQPDQTLSTPVGKAVGHAVDRIHAARGRSVVWEAEHAEDPVDVNEKNRELERRCAVL